MLSLNSKFFADSFSYRERVRKIYRAGKTQLETRCKKCKWDRHRRPSVSERHTVTLDCIALRQVIVGGRWYILVYSRTMFASEWSAKTSCRQPYIYIWNLVFTNRLRYTYCMIMCEFVAVLETVWWCANITNVAGGKGAEAPFRMGHGIQIYAKRDCYSDCEFWLSCSTSSIE